METSSGHNGASHNGRAPSGARGGQFPAGHPLAALTPQEIEEIETVPLCTCEPLNLCTSANFLLRRA